MTGVLLRDRREDDTGNQRRPHENEGRDWNYIATVQEHLEPPLEAGRGKGRFHPRAFGVSTALLTPC